MSIEAMKQALSALEAEISTEWTCNSYHPSIYPAMEALRTALSQQPATSDPMLVTEVKPRPLSYSLDDYHRAPSEGALHYTWQDKPHRLLYDLIAAVAYYAGKQPATGEPVARVDYSERGNIAWLFGPQLPDGTELFKRPAPSVPADVVRVPLQVLKDASEALGNFVSDHGWGDTDMQAMDNLDAYIARHEANRAAMLAAK